MRTFDAKRPFVFRKTRARFEGNVRSFFLDAKLIYKTEKNPKTSFGYTFHQQSDSELKKSDIESLRYRTEKRNVYKMYIRELSLLRMHQNVPGWPVMCITVRLRSDLRQNKERCHYPDRFLPRPVNLPVRGNPSQDR